MQLSSIHTTTFFHKCNNFFNCFTFGQLFSRRFLRKIFAVLCVVCEGLINVYSSLTLPICYKSILGKLCQLSECSSSAFLECLPGSNFVHFLHSGANLPPQMDIYKQMDDKKISKSFYLFLFILAFFHP